MNRSKILKIGIATVLLLGGVTFFYKKVYVPKSTYDVYYAARGTTAVEVFGIGELDAKDIYLVGTSTGGKILTIETDQGEQIKKGDVIATLDPAHDVYLNIYKEQPVKQLQNIATKSEVKHIEAVNQLAIKYDLNMTQYPDTDIPYSIDGIESGKYPVEAVQDLYNMLYDKGIQSRQAALEVGCMVEVVDINDLDDYIKEAERSNAPDVLEVFNYLRNGSYNHYWSFNDGLKNMNITDGCCSLGTEYCHPEYPQK